MPTLFELSHLIKDYGVRRVLDIDDLSLEQGSVYALRGANGAGKSTLLSLLAFLETPTDGRIIFNGQEVNYGSGSHLYHLRQKVVLVDQSPLMFSGSVYHNVEFGLRVRKIGRSERKKIVEKALEQVGMRGFIDHDAGKLSGGETKRVALARGLAVSPDVLLLDEPAANVDVENQRILFEIINKINKEFSTSIIYSTHQSPVDEQPSHQTLVLDKGKLRFDRQLNIFTASVKVAGGNRSVCKLAGCAIELELPKTLLATVEDIFSLYINPEKIELLDSSMTPPANSFGAEVLKLTRKGKKVYYTVHIGKDLLISSAYRSYKHNPVHLGQAIIIHIPEEAITVYSLSNGQDAG